LLVFAHVTTPSSSTVNHAGVQYRLRHVVASLPLRQTEGRAFRPPFALSPKVRRLFPRNENLRQRKIV
jgi:hypothetical protein